jgi:carboxyl-terminal processing protease
MKKILKNSILYLFVFLFISLVNMKQHPFQLINESFSFPQDWLPFQESIRLDRLNKTLYLIQESYVDPERIKFDRMYESALNRVSASVAKMSVQTHKHKVTIAVGSKKKDFPNNPSTMTMLRTLLTDSVRFVSENSKPETNLDDLEETAIEGVLETLDPHSNFLSHELYRDMQVGTSGKFGGLGIVIGLRESQLTVISPMDDTPAAKAGILPGDQIKKIENEITLGMTLNEAVDRMRGPKGEPVTITIERKGWTEPKDFHLVRDIIRVESAEYALLSNEIGYVRVKNFQEDTSKQLRKALAKISDNPTNGLKGLILDLRFNPGGLLDQAIEVSDLFLEKGTIVSTVGLRNRMKDVKEAELKNTQPNYPIVVLVNEGSASASEIVAGALQRNDRALVLGQKTFGKGTVQTLYDLPKDSALKLTVAKYLTPGDISIQSIGITPEIQTVPVVIDKDQTTFFYSEEEHGEAELERHFDNENKEQVKFQPDVTVEYLYQKPGEDKEVEREYSFSKLSQEEKQKKLLSDFETQTAYSILTQSAGKSKKEMEEVAKQVLKGVADTQNQQITAAMLKQGIDWSAAPANSKAKGCKDPVVSFQVNNTVPRKEILSGDKIEIQATMTNPSSCTLYQARASSKSESSFFDRREAFFGKLLPQQTVVRKIALTIPKYQPAGSYDLNFTFNEAHEIAPDNQNVKISILPAKQPQFAFDYDITDQTDKQSGFVAAKVPEKGEKIFFNMKIKNLGIVSSKEAFVSVKQEGNKLLTLKRGREKIENLEPNLSKDLQFAIEIPSNYPEPYFELMVTVSDMEYQSHIQKKIKVNLFQAKIAESREKPPLQHFEEPMISISNLTQLVNPQSSSAKIEGIVKDDMSVQDMYIVVNGQKTTYHLFQDKNKSQNFSLTIPLKKGKNEVIVVARDDQELTQTFPINMIGQ